MANSLKQRLQRKKICILDGAMGTELERRGVDIGLPLWSANALLVHPEIVQQIHSDYIAAGAEIITTNTFRTTRRTMRRANLPDRSLQLTEIAVSLAMRAREDSATNDVLIAGSMAPLEDCYRPDLVPPDAELMEEHLEHATRLADRGVDLLLLETMGTIREAYTASTVARSLEKEFVVSFICDDRGRLLGGERLSEAVKEISLLRPTAISINCIPPEFVGEILEELRDRTDVPLGVYANVGFVTDDLHKGEMRVEFSPAEYAAYALRWRGLGASIIGGCCGTTPGHVGAVCDSLTRWQNAN